MKRLTLIFIMTAIWAVPASHSAQWGLEVETGRVSSGYNDVRIPGDTGTRFSLSEELSIAPSAFFRARINIVLKRHTLSLLAAPKLPEFPADISTHDLETRPINASGH